MESRTHFGRSPWWLPLLFLVLHAGCANVGFDHGTTSLDAKSLVFGRILLDRGDGPEAISTMATSVVIRNIESHAEPGLVTQSMEKDGSFYWTLPPGRYQVSLVLNRFADGYMSYAFHVPEAGGAYYFGDLMLRGDKRFDTIGGANVRNVRSEIRDASSEAQAQLRRRNPQLRDVSVGKLALRDMTRPAERAQAYGEALAGARACCRSLAELAYQPLDMAARKSFAIGPDSPVFEFPTGRSRFLALRLPATPPPYTVSLRSVATPGNLGGVGRMYVFAPAIMLLDRKFQPIPVPEDGLFGTLPASALPPRAASMQADLRIDGRDAAASYLIVHTAQAILSGQIGTRRPGFAAVPGGALPTGTSVSLVLEPAISGEIEVTVAPR